MREHMNMLNMIAASILCGFLAKYGLTPSADGMEIKEYPPHIVWTQQARIPDNLVGCFDTDELYHDLMKYLIIHNQVLTAQKFGAYGVTCYRCTCGCGEFLYVSIYQ